MVMSYCKTRAAGAGYYLANQGEQGVGPSTWYISQSRSGLPGVADFGISDRRLFDTADHEAFMALAHGVDPTSGRRLCQNSCAYDRVGLHDFTFSPPKSVSVLWALADQTLAREIERIQVDAARGALDMMASRGAVVRQGKAGKVRNPVSVVGVLFGHGTSRAGDPQLHTHVVCVNVARRPDGGTGAIDVKDMLRWQGAAASLHTAEVAYRLRALGFEIEQRGSLFEMAAMPKCVLANFSTRRKAIEREINVPGTWSQPGDGPRRFVTPKSRAQVQRAVWVTRPKKVLQDLNDLKAQWRHRALAMGFDLANYLANHRELEGQPQKLREHELDIRAAQALESRIRKSAWIYPPEVHVAVARCLMGLASKDQIIRRADHLMTTCLQAEEASPRAPWRVRDLQCVLIHPTARTRKEADVVVEEESAANVIGARERMR